MPSRESCSNTEPARRRTRGSGCIHCTYGSRTLIRDDCDRFWHIRAHDRQISTQIPAVVCFCFVVLCMKDCEVSFSVHLSELGMDEVRRYLRLGVDVQTRVSREVR